MTAYRALFGFFRQQPFVFSLVVNCFLFLFFFLFFNPGYETVDDLSMSMLAQGVGFSETATANLLWSSAWIGFVLKWLYQAFPFITWYPVYLIFIHFVACTLLLFLLLKRQFLWYSLLLFIAYFLSIELYFLNNLQYTTTSVVIGQAGVFLFYVLQKRLLNPWRVFVIFLCFFLSIGIRKESFYLVMLLSAPLYLFQLLRYFSKALLFRFVGFFLLVVSVVVLNVCLQILTLSTEKGDWGRHAEKIELISPLVNNYSLGVDNNAVMALKKVGWSRNDFDLLKQWYYCDTSVFSDDTLRAFSTLVSKEKRKSNDYVLHNLHYSITRREFMALAGIFLILLVSFWAGKKVEMWIIVITGFVIFVIASLLLFYVRFPDRILLSLLSFEYFLMIFIVLPLTWKHIASKHIVVKGFQLLMIGFVAWSIWHGVKDQYLLSKNRMEKNSQLKSFLQGFYPSHDILFVLMGGEGFLYTDLLPFDDLSQHISTRLLWISSLNESPISNERLRQYQIKNLSLAIASNPKLMLVSNKKANELYKTFLSEHYGVQVMFVSKWHVTGSEMYIYQVTAK
jgi:hypothetical protein